VIEKTYESLERCRIVEGPLASLPDSGLNGCFSVPGPRGDRLIIVASNAWDWDEAKLPLPKWEHVSVHVRGRTPSWAEMDFVKNMFWRDDEWVVQFHPAIADHVNLHEHTLHLWKPVGVEIPTPPKACV